MEVQRPERPRGTGVLVLSGSSGRVDRTRASLLARHGAVAMPLRWFGGQGQQPGPWEVPVETFHEALDVLGREADDLAIVGTSFGAEAALLAASLDERVQVVVAFAPTSVVWAGYDEVSRRYTSHWTLGGVPVPYVPLTPATVFGPSGLPSYRATYERSLAAASAEAVEQASIAVERIPEVVLVTGGDDQVWPSVRFAEDIVRRRERHNMVTRHVTSDLAGHRATLPGESSVTEGRPMERGGTAAANAALGNRAWHEITEVLHLRP